MEKRVSLGQNFWVKKTKQKNFVSFAQKKMQIKRLKIQIQNFQIKNSKLIKLINDTMLLSRSTTTLSTSSRLVGLVVRRYQNVSSTFAHPPHRGVVAARGFTTQAKDENKFQMDAAQTSELRRQLTDRSLKRRYCKCCGT